MIEITGVAPTAKELRLANGAWPGMRWRTSIPVLMLTVGALGTTLLVVFAEAGGVVSLWVPILQLATLYGVIGTAWWLQRYSAGVARRTPIHGLACTWRIDETGVTVTTPLSHEHADWRAVKRVVVEKDRIIFAIMPMANRVLPLRCLQPGQLETLTELVAAMETSGRLAGGVDYALPAFDKA